MLLKMIIAFASACFTILFFGGFLDAGPTEIVKNILSNGAIAIIAILTLIAVGIYHLR